MKIVILGVVIMFVGILLAPAVIADTCIDAQGNSYFCDEVVVEADNPGPITGFRDIVNLFTKAARWLYTIFFIVATMYILFAAYTYLTAGGDSTKVEKATKMIKNAVIAIVIALLASGVALIINNFLTS